jgi:ribonuclease HI
MIEVWTDGSFAPKSRHAGYGYVIKKDKKPFMTGKGACPCDRETGSCNVSEYMALLAAMRCLLRERVEKEEIIFYSDSKLVVNQMNRVWGVCGGNYEKYLHEALALKWSFPKKSFVWIPREKNTEADALSTSKEPYAD